VTSYLTEKVNCAVLTGNSAGLRTVLSSRLSRRELRRSLRESHSFLSLPADITMASIQGTQPSNMNKREAILTWLAALFLSTIVTRTRKYREMTKKMTCLMGNLCCSREHSGQFFLQFHYTDKLHSLT
jgi:hypothetical protein